MDIRHWSRMPTRWITDERILEMTWKEHKSAATAALVLFVALCHLAVERSALTRAPQRKPAIKPFRLSQQEIDAYPAMFEPLILKPDPPTTIPPWQRTSTDRVSNKRFLRDLDESEDSLATVDYVAHASYDRLSELTGLSRKLIAVGLQLLVETTMIERTGSLRSGAYRILDLGRGDRWAKVPCREILSIGKTCFQPLTRLDMRSKYSLAAMKLYCYYASTRDHKLPYSHPSFETSYTRTGVAERDIPTANSLLLSVGLLSMYHRPSFEEGDYMQDNRKETIRNQSANRYYMKGYKSLFAKGAGGNSAEEPVT